jgi:hypothetical protein
MALFQAPLERRSPLTHAFIMSRAVARTLVCLLKVYPMLPSRPVEWVTPRPLVERFRYPSSHGEVEGDLYRPNTRGPHPGVVVCLGVVPFGMDHPQVPRLGEALARSGFAAMLYWSPAMRDFRLDPIDVRDIASAYDALLARADVDGARSGLLGTCVGGAFALMAATDARVRDRVSFVCAYAPYASMWTLARDIASATRERKGSRETWDVDPLTRKVYVHSVTALLEPFEADRLREDFAERRVAPRKQRLSNDGASVRPLLCNLTPDQADAALRMLPAQLQQRLDDLSPMHYLTDLRAPLVVLLHDRDDPVVPVSEARQLVAALGRRPGVHYTEFTVFKHLDPTRGRPSVPALTRELLRFAHAIYPMFRQTSDHHSRAAASTDDDLASPEATYAHA